MLLPTLVGLAPAAGADPSPSAVSVVPLSRPPGAVGFGGSVAGLGDVNGDGVGDLAVGAPGSDRVYVLSGATRSVLHDVPAPIAEGRRFGTAVASVGDIDKDGVPDFAVGAPSDPTTLPGPVVGLVFVFSGASGTLLRPLGEGLGNALDFGRVVSGPGDLSGDGVPDILVGAPRSTQAPGAVFAFSGADGAALWARPDPSAQPSASFGEVVVPTPDVTGDRVNDVLVSVPSPSGETQPTDGGGQVLGLLTEVLGGALNLLVPEQVHVVSGATGVLARSTTDPAPLDAGGYGGALAVIGDQDGDGVVDHLVAERRANRLHLYSGDDGVLLRTLAAPTTTPDQGVLAVVRVEDRDGDGRDDFWVGVPSARSAHLLNGTGTVLASASAPLPQGSFGGAMAGVGDLGGDGRTELVVGDPAEPGGGAAYVLYSGAAEPAGRDLVRLRVQTSASTTTSTTPVATTSIPATATLPKPVETAGEGTGLAGTGATDRSVPGLLALGLAMAGALVLRRARDPGPAP